MENQPVLEAEGLVRTFHGTEGDIQVLRGLDLQVLRGEVIAIIGQSGVGKSTLLHILGSLDKPDSGTVRVNGSDIFTLSDREMNRMRNKVIGFIFQFHYLLPEFTALENVMMPSLVGGSTADWSRENARKYLDAVGLSGRLHHRPSELSGGEQQRVAVARAFANDPEIILADEPTGNLDDSASRALNDLILDLSQREKKSFVVVTHKKDFSHFAGRVLLLEAGTLQRYKESGADPL
jgi:lipoprotein-releasing system ATP-binding protein